MLDALMQALKLSEIPFSVFPAEDENEDDEIELEGDYHIQVGEDYAALVLVSDFEGYSRVWQYRDSPVKVVEDYQREIRLNKILDKNDTLSESMDDVVDGDFLEELSEDVE